MSLTAEQQAVVDFDKGALVLIASPGTGKTHTLTHRVVNLIAKGVKPCRILCITFTNKAAKEMKDRISRATGVAPTDLSIFTFHGLCNYWLRKEGKRIGKVGYTIMDDDATSSALKSIAANIPLNQSAYQSFSSAKDKAAFLSKENELRLKEKLGDLRRYLGVIANKTLPEVKKFLENSSTGAAYLNQAVTAYEDYKAHSNLMDFDDLHKYGTELFLTKLDLGVMYDYVQVDEAQDSSTKDLNLLKALNIPNIVAVGD